MLELEGKGRGVWGLGWVVFMVLFGVRKILFVCGFLDELIGEFNWGDVEGEGVVEGVCFERWVCVLFWNIFWIIWLYYFCRLVGDKWLGLNVVE